MRGRRRGCKVTYGNSLSTRRVVHAQEATCDISKYIWAFGLVHRRQHCTRISACIDLQMLESGIFATSPSSQLVDIRMVISAPPPVLYAIEEWKWKNPFKIEKCYQGGRQK
jgi:hypothetical protein